MSSPAPVINTTSAGVERGPNPAATHGRESGVSINMNYATSPLGMLKILEFVFGLITWALIASSYSAISSHQFVLFVTITSWITTVITLFVFLCGCHADLCSGAPCMIIDFVHNAFWALFYFLAACVISSFTFQVPQLIAGAVFSFFVTFLYIVHTFLSFREWRGEYPWN